MVICYQRFVEDSKRLNSHKIISNDNDVGLLVVESSEKRCPLRNNNNRAQPKVRCYHCNHVLHYLSECRNRERRQRNISKSQRRINKMTIHSNEDIAKRLFTVITRDEMHRGRADTYIVVGSGGSEHVVYNELFIKGIEEVELLMLELANRTTVRAHRRGYT